jgi:SAM-dependent methyltransferase
MLATAELIAEFEPETYWESRLSDRFSLGGVGYRVLGEGFNRWMYEVRRRLFLARVPPLLPHRSVEVLDVGSGTGFYVELWKRLGARVTGSDLTATSVSRLSAAHADCEFVRADIGASRSDLPNRRFDAISAFDVLYHIVDDESYRRAFVNLSSRLADGGLLLFTENFLSGPALRSRHWVSRSLTEITAAVELAGLEVVERRPVFVLMSEPVDSTNRLHRTWWLILARTVSKSEAAGWLLGACLCAAEVALAKRLRDGPSTEMMVCRKRAASPTASPPGGHAAPRT